jgi:flavorubredoxin
MHRARLHDDETEIHAGRTTMQTKIDEIADGIYRLSVYVPDIAPPAGLTFNHFLIRAAEPMLFHCGLRGLFPTLSEAVAKLMPASDLRWIGFGHVEADECGAMNSWLAAAPNARVVHGATACMVSVNDLADRTPQTLADGEVVDLGGKRVRYIDTPHVPHGWEAGVLYEETTGTLLCGDLFTHLGKDAAVTDKDIVGPAIEAERLFRYTSLGPSTAPNIRKLVALAPRTLALMHGASYNGNGGHALSALADHYEAELSAAMIRRAA